MHFYLVFFALFLMRVPSFFLVVNKVVMISLITGIHYPYYKLAYFSVVFAYYSTVD